MIRVRGWDFLGSDPLCGYYNFMSIILALETSLATCSVALQTDKQIYFRAAPAVIAGSNQILQLVSEVLQEADIAIKDLTAIAWSHGPGSFTGLRIGAAAVQGLALPHTIPLIPISSLAAQALQGYQQRNAPFIGVIINAHGGNAYVGWYQSEGLKPIMPETMLPIATIQLPNQTPWVLVGDLPPIEIPGLVATTPWLGSLWPSAHDILQLALSSLSSAQPPDHVQPNYLNLPNYQKS
jgi:tRNA threonylcarbamoyladenosine biosynthesis protein TsaB